jgi:hypothetical protein
MKKPFPKLFSENLELDPRHIWATIRSWMEVDNFKHLREGGKRSHHWNLLESQLKIFAHLLKATGLYGRGATNA